MPENVSACPLCGSGHSDAFDRRTFRGQPVFNRVCRACGLVYQSPRMTAAEADAYYAAAYRQTYQGSQGPDAKDLAIQRQRAEALTGFLRATGAHPARHLDIGCSAGLLLEAVQAAFGAQPAGIEPGDAYREFARGRGLTVHTGLDELRATHPDRFDLISLSHVLEHLPDPAGYLAMLRADLLAADGRVLIEVPNLYAHDSFETAHLSAFSAHTLRETLRKAGFTVVRLRAHGNPRSRLLPLYLTVLARPAAQPASGPVRPERGVACKRRLGLLRRRLLERLLPGRAWLPLPE